jgi:cytochrome oxidase Cu insertion factor (SCO1/SenC/PrrC family)
VGEVTSGATDATRATGTAPARARRPWLLAGALGVVVIVAAAAVVIAVRWQQRDAVAGQRPWGIPASVPTGMINLMDLAPVPARPAPGFTLTDQDGHALSLSRFRGRVVVLEFMDPHCTDICPLVSQEFVDAYHDLGRTARKVVFAAVNVNQYFNQVPNVLAYSRAHQLVTIPGWHFFTGPVPALRAIWRAYGVEVQAPSPDADIVHTSVVFVIGPGGTERYVAAPMADHSSAGTSYLPAGQISAWGRGIAEVARTLAS